jgi:hypothetical protein
LLTELFLRVLGRKLSLQRELCKRILIAAAWSLHVPVFIMPSGAVSLGMCPAGKEPKVATSLLRLVHALPVPVELQALIVAYAGDAWVGPRKGCQANICQFTSSYALEASEPKTRKLVRSMLPYTRTTLCFSDMPLLEAEWVASEKLLWLLGKSVWPLIIWLRQHLRRTGAPAGSVTIRGFGVVLI